MKSLHANQWHLHNPTMELDRLRISLQNSPEWCHQATDHTCPKKIVSPPSVDQEVPQASSMYSESPCDLENLVREDLDATQTHRSVMPSFWTQKTRGDDKTRSGGKLGGLKSQNSQDVDWTLSTNWTSPVSMGQVVSSYSLWLGLLLTPPVFHHDGPFDACNPNRNRKNARAAPMQAFPKDSRNMVMGGSGPLNEKLNLDQIHGTGQEAHIDYNTSAIAEEYGDELRRPNPGRSASFHPTARVEPLHGEETIGLGTSTFLEGAPASRAAMQRRESENEAAQMAGMGPGVSRKMSLAQKIRGVRPTGRMTSPEPGILSSNSHAATGKSESAANPFFRDYDQEYVRKGAQVAAVEGKNGRSRAPSSPRLGLGLERIITSEGIGGGDDGTTKSGGFLDRVKSLKGGRKARNERREASG